MTFTSAKAAGPAAKRRRRRHRQQLKHIRVRHTKRVLREQVDADVEVLLNIYSDRGFHLDPDVDVCSDTDPSRNRFSALDADWSSTTSRSITPMGSNFSLSETNRCNSNADSAPFAVYPTSVPTIPPLSSLPIVNVPDSVSTQESKVVLLGCESLHATTNHASTSSCEANSLLQLQSPSLYHNASSKILGVDGRDPSPLKSSAMTCGQGLPDLDSRSYELDEELLTGSSGQNPADGAACQAIPKREPVFIGAALPDMSKAVPTRDSAITCLDPGYYKNTRPYLGHADKAGECSDLGGVMKSSSNRETMSKTDELELPILNPTITCPRFGRKMTYVSPRACPHGLPLTFPLTVPSGASNDPAVGMEKLHLWEPTTSTQGQPQNSMRGFIFPTLEPAAGCKASIRSQSTDAAGGYVKSMTSLLDSSHRSRLRETGLRPPGTCTTSASNLGAFDTHSAMAAYEKTMNKASTVQANTETLTGLWTPPEKLHSNDSRRDSVDSLPALPSHCPPAPRHTSPIRDAAIQSAMKPTAVSDGVKTADLKAGPTTVCNALVPAKLYEQQYLGWPQRRNGEEVGYKDKAWSSFGVYAYTARLRKEEAAQQVTTVPVNLHKYESRPTPTTEMDIPPQSRTWFEKVAHVQRLQEEQVDVRPKGEYDTKLETGVDKGLEHVAGDPGIKTKHQPECQDAEACLKFRVDQSHVLRAESNHDLCELFAEKPKRENSKAAESEYFVHGALVGDDGLLQFSDELVKTPGSETGWSEIGTESDDGSEWDWSEDDLGV